MSEHTKKPFRREPRYMVFKLSDVSQCLPQPLFEHLHSIGDEIAAGRLMSGKPPFNAVVVEQDWPEFELVWEMIEARMRGKGNDVGRIAACLKMCEDTPTASIDAAIADGITANYIAMRAEEMRDTGKALLQALKTIRGAARNAAGFRDLQVIAAKAIKEAEGKL